jgi:hypothetical protein
MLGGAPPAHDGLVRGSAIENRFQELLEMAQKRATDNNTMHTVREKGSEKDLHVGVDQSHSSTDLSHFNPDTTHSGSHVTIIKTTALINCQLPGPFEEGRCEIVLSRMSGPTSKLAIRMTHQDILSRLMIGLGTPLSWPTRYFIKQVDNDIFEADFGSAKLVLSKVEAEDICACVDEVCGKYREAINKAEISLETWRYSPISNEDIKGFHILRVPQWLWELMRKFAGEFDGNRGSSTWHIFSRNNISIDIFTKTRHTTLWPKADINYWSFLPTGYIDIIYKPNILHYYSSEDVSSNIGPYGLWTAHYTKEWITQILLPKLQEHYSDDFIRHRYKVNRKDVDCELSDTDPSQITTLQQLETYIGHVQEWAYMYPAFISTLPLRPYYNALTNLMSKLEIDPSSHEMGYVAGRLGVTASTGGQWGIEDFMRRLRELRETINTLSYEDHEVVDLVSRGFAFALRNLKINFSQADLNAAKLALKPLWELVRFENRYVLPSIYTTLP